MSKREETSDHTADQLIRELKALRSESELAKIRKRLAPDEEAFGVRMGHLFDVAKSYPDLLLSDVELLLAHPAYEPRMAAMCILDFKARQPLDDESRYQLYQLYLHRHDRLTTWDMVDRAAPRVVGGYLVGRSPDPLHELAEASEPLKRRTAITAPLYFVRAGSDNDLAAGFAIAKPLVSDPEPLVHQAAGIFLKHAGSRDPDTLIQFLLEHASSMRRSALRVATEKLDPAVRDRF